MTVKQRNTFFSNTTANKTSGFTLLELLVVVAIAAIVLAIATPGYTSFMDREKVAALSSEFESSLAVVRSAAIKSGVPVLLCASSDGQNCSGQWSQGWLAFRDNNRDGAIDAADSIVLRRKNDSSRTELSITSISGDDVNTVSFNYRGAPDTALSVSVKRGDQDRSMTVTAFGRTRHHD